jgi:hypothetical protein
MSDQTSRRVRIVSPYRRGRASPRRALSREIDEQTRIGEVYLHSLVRGQLRLALRVCLVMAAVVGGLPLLLALEPELGARAVLGVPLSWLVLGLLLHPVLVTGAWFYIRQAERNEQDFVELVERS